MLDEVGIIGRGRFGQVLADLLATHFTVKFDDEAYSCTTLFIAVPIRALATAVRDLAQKIVPHATVIDVCSVKVYAVQVMQQYLAPSIGIIATHPLFGPDSMHRDESLKIMMHKVRDPHQQYTAWKNFFTTNNVNVIEMTPEQHDQQAARSQGITHFIGRILQCINARPTSIDTAGYRALLEVMHHTCNDSWELFADLQRYNPYTQPIIQAFATAVRELQDKISAQ